MTTAHAHKSGVIFHFFSKTFQTKKKIKALRPKMTKIASRGPALTIKVSRDKITVRIGYRVTGYNDLPGIMIGLTKIKIKTSKRHTKYHYIKCIPAVVIYRI